jgi:tripartite-type tricarboxylate transporter receptor subunit TctC
MSKFMMFAVLLFGIAAAAASRAQAPDYPTRPIRMLVPFAPGGVVDTTARLVTQKLTERLGWQFTVDNRPGGNGFIAVTAVSKSVPDGYTLLMAHSGEFAVNPAIFKEIPYDLERDFIAITMVSDTPMVVLAHAQSPISSFRDLVAQAKAKPGDIGFSSPGNGSINHLAGEWLAVAAGIKLLHVPYKGGAPAATAVAAGDVPLGVVAIPGALPHLKSGRVKVLGVTTAKRSAYGPDWITAQEAGIPELDASNWVGLFAPKGVPQAIIEKIHGEMLKVLEQKDVRERLAAAGGEPAGMSQAQFLAKIKTDADRFRKIVQTAGIKAE